MNRQFDRHLLRLLLNDEQHGPLPALLLLLTVVTGLVDAVSILSLGRVFVANMTGNVVFVGFAIAGAPGFSLGASLSALAGFLVGAAVGGRVVNVYKPHRSRLLLAGSLLEFVCVTGGLLVISIASSPFHRAVQDGTAAAVALALGTQNAVVRTLAVPDLTTTVLTLTLTGLAAEARAGLRPTSVRRALAVATMFGGAVLGAVLVLEVAPAAGLGAASGLLLVVVVASWALGRGDRSWHRLPA